MMEKEIELTQKEDGSLTTKMFIDAELDAIQCDFNNDDCVQLNTKNHEYITLSVNNLLDLVELILASQKVFDGDKD